MHSGMETETYRKWSTSSTRTRAATSPGRGTARCARPTHSKLLTRTSDARRARIKTHGLGSGLRARRSAVATLATPAREQSAHHASQAPTSLIRALTPVSTALQTIMAQAQRRLRKQTAVCRAHPTQARLLHPVVYTHARATAGFTGAPRQMAPPPRWRVRLVKLANLGATPMPASVKTAPSTK